MCNRPVLAQHTLLALPQPLALPLVLTLLAPDGQTQDLEQVILVSAVSSAQEVGDALHRAPAQLGPDQEVTCAPHVGRDTCPGQPGDAATRQSSADI